MWSTELKAKVGDTDCGLLKHILPGRVQPQAKDHDQPALTLTNQVAQVQGLAGAGLYSTNRNIYQDSDTASQGGQQEFTILGQATDGGLTKGVTYQARDGDTSLQQVPGQSSHTAVMDKVLPGLAVPEIPVPVLVVPEHAVPGMLMLYQFLLLLAIPYQGLLCLKIVTILYQT